MRRFTLTVIFLLGVPIANASTITVSDSNAALAINRELLTVVKDMNQAYKGKGDDFSPKNVCMKQVKDYLLVVQSDVQSLAELFLIASQMTAARDEATALHITDIAVDRFLKIDAPATRAQINRLSSLCSRYSLPAAKALRSVELIDKSVSLAQSVSKRVKVVERRKLR